MKVNAEAKSREEARTTVVIINLASLRNISTLDIKVHNCFGNCALSRQHATTKRVLSYHKFLIIHFTDEMF